MVRILFYIGYDYCYANVTTFLPAPEDMAQKSLSTIFDLVPRIAVGSIIAYIIGQHVDVFIFSTIKRYSAQIKHLSFVLMVVPC